MAQLPGTQFATAQPSGQTGQTLWGPPPRGEGQEIAEGISKLGTVMLSYALNVQKQEMAAEYYEKRRLIDEAGWAARNAVTGDEEADKALWDKFQSDAQAVAGSSKYKDVNDELTQHVNQVSPNWQQGMFTTSLKIRSDNADDQLRLSYTKILENGTIDENGRIPEGVEMLDKMLSLRSITKTKYDALIASMPGDIRIARADRLMTMGNYNLAQEELKQTDKMDLTTEQLKDKRTLKAMTEQAKNERAEVFDKDTRKKILAGGDALKTLKREDILNHPDLSGPQMNVLINLFDSRIDGVGKKYTNEQKLAAYAEVIQETDPEKKLALLFKHAGAFTPEKAQSLYDSIANPDDIMNTSFYMEWDRQINSVFGAVDNQDVDKEKIPAFAKMKDDLREIAKTTGKDYTKAQAQLEALTTPVKEEKGRSWLGQWWDDTTESMKTGEGAIHRRRRLVKEREQMFEGDLYGVLVQRYPEKEELILKAKANGWTAEAIAESLK